MPNFSERAAAIPLSPFRKLIPYANQAKSRGVKVYHLNIGQPDIETPPAAWEKLRNIDIKILEYAPAAGLSSYIEKLLEYYKSFDINLEKEDVLVTTGASEALKMALFCAIDFGEEIIVPEPFYANYNGFAHMGDVKIKPVTCHIEDGFALPEAEAFEAAIGPKTKALMINNPGNPTGTLYSKDTLDKLGELVKKNDLFLISDEVYREFCYDGNRFFSALNIPGIRDHVIMLDSISKRFSACGARVGALVSYNKEVMEAALNYARLRLSAPVLGQILAEATLGERDKYIEEVRAEYDRRRMCVYKRLQKMPGVTSYKPGGAFYCFARFPVKNTDHFCRWLLEDFHHEGETVMLSTGEAFYATPGLGKDELRIAFVLECKELEKAMDILEAALEVYPGRK